MQPQNALGVNQQTFAGIHQHHPTTRALEQRLIDDLFEALHLLAQRGLGPADPIGGTGQRPDFDEFTVVLKGVMRVEHEAGVTEVKAGQAIIARKGEWVRYSTPEGAEYMAICVPAFAPDTVHRDV